MDSKNYNRYLSGIKAANKMSDTDKAKEILQDIKMKIIAVYGYSDPDVELLIKNFKYNV